MDKHASLSTRQAHAGTLYFVALLREELGHRIKVARTAAGFSQQQLAPMIGLKNAQDVSRYERGKSEVPDFRIDLIAEVTGRPRSFFLRDPNEPEPSAGDGELAAVQRELADIRVALQVLPRIEELLRAQAKSSRGARGAS